LNIQLPDLQHYRTGFQQKGVIWPLPHAETCPTGLLQHLPKIAADKTGWPWTVETDPFVYATRAYWPKLTIVTPSFNQKDFIEQTIRSVLLQNYPNLEYIILDGGSTDGSVDVIKRYAPWLSYWQSARDAGQGQAINQGFSLASGDYYAWLNSDDYYLPDAFRLVMKKFLQSGASFVYGNVLDFIVEKNNFGESTPILPLSDYFIRIPTLAQPACFWSATIHQPIWEQLHCALDYELWLRIVKGSKRRLIRSALAVAHVHAEAKTSNPKMKEKWQEDHLAICSPDAHGPVPNWDSLAALHRLRIKIHQWLRLG
jgi:hypothetical protein